MSEFNTKSDRPPFICYVLVFIAIIVLIFFIESALFNSNHLNRMFKSDKCDCKIKMRNDFILLYNPHVKKYIISDTLYNNTYRKSLTIDFITKLSSMEFTDIVGSSEFSDSCLAKKAYLIHIAKTDFKPIR